MSDPAPSPGAPALGAPAPGSRPASTEPPAPTAPPAPGDRGWAPRSGERLGLGLAALGRPGYLTLGHGQDLGDHGRSVAAMEAHCHRILDAAWAGGVRMFDTARGYGLAEAFLSRWLAARAIAPGTARVASKWGYEYVAGWRVDAPVHERKDHALPMLQTQWAESRASLGDHLSLYQIHSATPESGVLEDGAVLRELARLRADSGVAMGVSVSGPGQAGVIGQALRVEADGVALFSAVQATFNLMDRSCATVLAEAKAAGRTVLVKEAVANGRLTARNARDPAVAPLLAQAAQAGVGPDALAIAWILDHPFVDVVLSGAATVAQLASNLTALEVMLDQDQEAISRLSALETPPAAYWAARKELAWT